MIKTTLETMHTIELNSKKIDVLIEYLRLLKIYNDRRMFDCCGNAIKMHGATDDDIEFVGLEEGTTYTDLMESWKNLYDDLTMKFDDIVKRIECICKE